jgi:phosphatidate cytidylyltransferase
MGGEMNELIKRILTGGALALLTLFLIFKSPVGFTILIAVGGLIVGYEFAKLSKMKFTSFLILFIMITLTVAFWTDTHDGALLFLNFLHLLFWSWNLFIVLNYPHIKPKTTTFKKAIYLFLLVTPLIFLVFLQEHKPLLLLLLLIVWGADSFAYFSGKAFGRHKLAPNLSGGKTIEGMIGGLLGVLLITGVWMFFNNLSNWGYLLVALLTATSSVVGDLYESIYKREAGVKDSGNILPGHGGMFDRLDGLLAATPIFIASLQFL